MIYDIRHLTTYSYAAPVRFAACVLRVFPRPGDGQTVRASKLTLDPSAGSLLENTDTFGNHVAMLTIDTAHRALTVTIESRVEVRRRRQPRLDLSPPWEQVRDLAAASQGLEGNRPVHFIYPSRLVPLDEEVRAYAQESFPPDRPIQACLIDFNRRMHADFSYDPKATVVTTPLAEAFEARRGVCQDFAQVMIAGLRGLGLPAAYVSGYLRTVPPPGQKRLEGADATHAWVAAWAGDDLGWIGLDPTNDLIVAEDHIVVAIGRDYADVSPLTGVIVGAGSQSLDVAVDVVPVE